MGDTGFGSRNVAAGATAVAILGLVLVPLLLFSQTLSMTGLAITGAAILALGLVVRRSRRAGQRRLGALLAVLGAATIIVAVGLFAVVLAGWGRGY